MCDVIAISHHCAEKIQIGAEIYRSSERWTCMARRIQKNDGDCQMQRL
jgi:hypothetical protein